MIRALLLAAVVLAGCGAARGSHPERHKLPKIAVAQADHEYPPATEPHQQVAAVFRSPDAALAAFTSAYVNWSATTVTADMRQLAARSIGQARAATELAAAETAADYELQRDGIANSGSLEAIAPLRGQADQFVVVTREQTTATGTTAYQGLEPAWHVALATVSRIGPGEWVVSGWQPQS